MTSKEYAIYQLKQLKGKTLKEKIEHILTYYWVPIVAFLSVLILLISLIVHYATLKEPALAVCCVNSSADSEKMQRYVDVFAQNQGIDLSEYEVELRLNLMIDTSEVSVDYQNTQLLLGLLGSGSADVMTADTDTMIRYAYQGAYVDLSEVMNAEQLETLAPYLLYIDQAYQEELEKEPVENPSYPEPTKPEGMERPIPVVIKMESQWELAQICYGELADNAAIGIVVMGENRENAIAFLDFILENECSNNT